MKIIDGLLKKQEMWYRQDGTPAYDATLREARKENLFPRVTNIMSVWPKPQLDAWKQEQCILAALTLPRADGESLEAFAKRVVEDSQRQAKDTADWGTGFHELIESHMNQQEPTPTPPYAPFYEKWVEWFNASNIKAVALEQVVVSNAFGYAGRMDHLLMVNGEITIADTKTRSVKNGKPAWYDEQAMQLAAYSRCLPTITLPAPTQYMSIIVNRDAPEAPYVKFWETDEIELGWKRFRACFEVWKLQKNYDPCRQ